jgi:hypothetical protein
MTSTNKIIGYVLLLVGVLLITLPLWQTYNIFTGKSVPAQIFVRPISLTVNKNVSTFDVEGQMQNALIKVLPIDLINNTLNLSSWLLLMWILIYGGGKIADIGVKLLNGNE